MSSTLAPWVYTLLETLWLQGPTLAIPADWKAAWITCVPKRTIRTPRDIRPIALQCPLGKAVLRTVVRQALTHAAPRLTCWPIYAYLKGRSTDHALLRVHTHLKEVRDRCHTLQDTAWNRSSGRRRPKCHGGLTLSLDLSNAFDTVDRHDIAHGLTLVDLPSSLCTLLLGWLLDVHYFIGHKHLQQSIPVTRGIRQGCVASPFLWLMWSLSFLDRLAHLLSPEWIRKSLSLYADDILCQWSLTCPADFDTALTQVGTILNLLEEMHLTVSLTKSVTLLRLTGTARKELMKKHTCVYAGQKCLIIPRGEGRVTYLPLVQQHKYLGTMLTYKNPEDCTMRYRLKCGQLAYFRLIKFLGKSHRLPISLKLRLWQQCVMCSYLYGIYAVGITSQGCTLFTNRVIGDLRRLTGNWSYVTHVTNSDLCASLKLPLPIDDLQVRWHQHITRQLANRQNLEPTDVLLQFDEHSHWQQLQDTLAYWYHASTLETTPAPQCWPCPHCTKTFAHRPHMRAHITKEHKELDPVYVFEPLRDAIQGLPQCRHCLLKLSDTLILKQHIERQWCHAFDPDAKVNQPLCQSPAIQAQLRQQDWAALLSNEELCRSLVHNCGVCQQWCAQSNSLAAHCKKLHGDAYLPSFELRPAIAAHIKTQQRHCTACALEVNQQHTCPVVMQLAMLRQVQKNLHVAAETPRPEASEASPCTPTASASTGGTKRKSPFDGAYAETDLEIQGPTFVAERDCLGGRNECRHCTQPFGDHIGLRRHIEKRRCTKFLAHRPPQPWILRYQEQVQHVMLSLHPEQWICEDGLLERLNRECAMCGRQFEHYSNLNLHLQDGHPAEVREAQPYAQHLIDNFVPHGGSCLCGSWRTTGGAHQCAVALQLGMLRHHCRREAPLPHFAMIPRMIDWWLLKGQWEEVLQHPEYSYVFSNYCSLCLNRMSSLDQLWEHMEDFHADMLPLGIQELDAHTCRMQHCCPACRDLPAQIRATAPRCPIFLNCILLQHLRHGPSEHGSPRGGRAIRTAAGLRLPPHHRADDGGPPGHGSAPQAATAARMAGFFPRLGPTILMSPDGPTTTSTRRCAEFNMPRSLLGVLHGQENPRGSSPNPGPNQEMAPTAQGQGDHPHLAEQPMPSPVRGDAPTTQSAAEDQGWRSSSHQSHSDAPHHGGQTTTGPSMGCSGEELEAPGGQNAHTYRSAPDAGTTAPTMQSRRHDSETACPPEHQCPNERCATLEDADQPASRPHDATASGSAEEQLHLAVHSMPHATMEPTTVFLSTKHPEELAQNLQRPSIQAAILQLRCLNERNQCWMNSNILAWMWTTMMGADVQWTDFGLGANEVSNLLAQNSARGLNLMDAGLNPRDWDGGVQQDSAEYTAEILSYFKPPRLHLGWEKRIMVGSKGETLEINESRVPVFLRLGNSPTSLQSLLDGWTHDENAIAAFREASVYKVLQLDRVCSHQGILQKLTTSLTLDEMVQIPCFVDSESTVYELLNYEVVAVVYHEGTAEGGHLRAGLRTGPPTEWLSTEDGRIACLHPGLLRDIQTKVVQIWLVRSTALGNGHPRPPSNDFTTLVQQIAIHMQDRDDTQVYSKPHLRTLLSTRCVLCGQWIFRFRDSMKHLQQCHPQASMSWQLYKRKLAAIPCSPCRWCTAWNVDDHDCLVLFQALLTLNVGPQHGAYTVSFDTPHALHQPAAPCRSLDVAMDLASALDATPNSPQAAHAAGADDCALPAAAGVPVSRPDAADGDEMAADSQTSQLTEDSILPVSMVPLPGPASFMDWLNSDL